MSLGRASPPLITFLARTPQLVDLLPLLHQHAMDATGGRRSLLFEHNVHGGALEATSAFGLGLLPKEPWLPTAAEARMFSSDTFSRPTTNL